VLLNLLSSITSLFLLLLLKPFMDMLFSTATQPIASTTASNNPLSFDRLTAGFTHWFAQYQTAHGASKALFILCLLIVLFSFFKSIFLYLAAWIINPMRQGVVLKLRNMMYQKILDQPLVYFNEQRKGDLMTRTTSDVNEVEWGILNSIEITTRDPFMIILYLCALIVISPQLTFFIIPMLIITGLVIGSLGKTLRKDSKTVQERYSNLLSSLEETLGGLKVIKGFVAEQYMQDRYQTLNKSYNVAMVQINRKRDLASPLSEFLGIVVLATVLWYGGNLVLKNNFSLDGSGFILYIALFSQLIQPAKNFSRAFAYIQRALASYDRIEEILIAPNPLIEPTNPQPYQGLQQSIEIKNMSFWYNPEKPILTDINLSINKGKMIALVGQSGAGKSTLADLIARFHDTCTGSITIDTINIRNINSRNLRQHLGIVTQEALLFNDTIYNNIAFGNPTASYNQVIAAAQVANAHEFITQLTDGYDTNVGDRGSKLSGGERQRITIARAVLKNPDLLILDEATAALDAENERLVQDALYNLLKGRTSIVIAHRLATIQHADEIIVMQDGRIVERGTHTQLNTQNGYYKRLVDMQRFA
jgi:subfamily B ATP-binding cassette protein MsbA